VPLFIFRRADDVLLGAITLDNIRRGPAQAATLGYWIGEIHARQGYMREAIGAVVHYAFRELDLSRVEAACLPENAASRGVLEKAGFKYEGVAQSYLQIAGAGATMCFTRICAMTGAGGPRSGDALPARGGE
jgi:[ribosomal protein S5]-alanine N-acetyltransferase